LYLIGNLPRARSVPAVTSQSSTNQHATASSTPSGTAIATTTLPHTSPVAPRGSAPPATAAATGPLRHELKPLRDKRNLAVFGTGLERPADFGGADLSSPDVPSPDLQDSADRASSED
jgi:hypothetical protein